MNDKNREECGMMSPLLWILCKLAAENRAMEVELDEAHNRIYELTKQCDELALKCKQLQERDQSQ